MTVYDDIRGQLSIPDVAEMLDIELPNRIPGKAYSPVRDETEPSLYLEESHWHDFGTGEGGDVIALVRYVTGASHSEALKWLSQGTVPDGERTVKAREPREVRSFDRWLLQNENSRNYDLAKAWFVVRYGQWIDFDRLLEQRIIRLGRDHIYIPHWADSDVVGVKTRSFSGGDAGRKSAVTGSTFSHRLYRSYPGQLENTGLPAVLVEGESDYWAADQYFNNGSSAPLVAQVYALPCGAGVVRKSFVAELERHPVVWVATDNDDAGNRAADEFPGYRLLPPEGCDFVDGLEAGWRPHV